jgi:hypothetical protein
MRLTNTLRTCVLAALTLLAACTKTETNTVTVSPADSTYLVEWIPGESVVGKSTFQLRVRRRADFAPATGLAITVRPTMVMTGMTHSTPVDVVTESATQGTYDGTIYYLMASGTGMGYWALDLSVGGEVHTVYPSVDMAMGTDTVKRNLWGASDGMGSMAKKYFLFRDGPYTGEHQLRLHVSRAEDSLMTFKPVFGGATLGAPTGAVTSVSLTASTDPAFATSAAGVDGGHGHWALDLSSFTLDPAVATTVYVRLQVNGEDKTTDGAAASAANAAAVFSVTPQ